MVDATAVKGSIANAPPRIWLLLGDKLGDNAQVLALARALDLPHEVRRVVPRPEWVLGKPPFRPSLEHLDARSSDPLEPPWPDLIVTVGRRPSMAALWVQDRSPSTRLVIVGRPKKWIDRFALVVAPGQFRVPPRGNVINLELPLLRADEAAVADAGRRWRDRLADLPRPLTAVMVGGVTKPYRFDAAVATDLLAELRRLQAADGGTVYLTTSRRTRPDVAEALAEGLPEGAVMFRWDAGDGADNPYLALLALADRFVVTGDSVSMMVEVAGLGRPLAIAELPLGFDRRDRLRHGLARAAEGPLGRLAHPLQRLGVAGYARDLGSVHRLLYSRGAAAKLGDGFRAARDGLADELRPVVERVRLILDGAAQR